MTGKRADDGMAFLLRYENVAWYEDGAVRILDRRIYPIETRFVVCRRHEEVAQAIVDMVTQSAGPYAAAAMGMALAAYEVRDRAPEAVMAHLEAAGHTLSHARPTTARNMMGIVSGALDAARAALERGETGAALVDALQAYALDYQERNYRSYQKTGAYLADQIPMGGTIMTQCFAETILGTLFVECRRRGNAVKVICPETRPYFQGARLTASVAQDMGFDTTVISDNMPGYVLKQKQVDVFTSAADVITMDGHVVNKVGTFQIALAAHYWGIPYYVTGRPNRAHPGVDSVHIEERDPELVCSSMGTRVTMEGVRGYYPAFDITPPKLVSAVITDRGVFSPYDLKAYDQGGESAIPSP